MNKFNNPLDSIRIASPCRADWNEMYGNGRKRFCAECRLTVYNLSGMTRNGAERLLIESEGRLCVRFFRRADGTLLTEDCPVGWNAMKLKASKASAAILSLLIGFFSGIASLWVMDKAISAMPIGNVPAPQLLVETEQADVPIVGEIDTLSEWEGKVELPIFAKSRTRTKTPRHVLGRIEDLQQMREKNVASRIR